MNCVGGCTPSGQGALELFECECLGHLPRLIKRVRTSVIALVPLTEGIKATLLNSGLSRVVISGETF